MFWKINQKRLKTVSANKLFLDSAAGRHGRIFQAKEQRLELIKRRKGSDLSLGNYHMFTFSNFAARMHLTIFCLSRLKKFWHLAPLYCIFNLSILLCKILEIRLIFFFFKCMCGGVFLPFLMIKLLIYSNQKKGLWAQSLLFFLQLYQLVQWETLPFLTNFASLRGAYICRPLDLRQH